MPADNFWAWPVSAETPEALAAQARNLHAHARAHPGLSPASIGLSLATTRSVFPHRAVVIAGGRDGLLAGLAALASGATAAGVIRGTAGPPAITAFAFPGQGSQRPGMGAQLHAAYPVFARTLDEACDCLDPHLAARLPDPGPPLRDVMFAGPADPAAALLNQTAYTQAALFAYQTALFRLATSFGLTPDYLTGHSIGELTAAHAAGIWTLADAAALVAARGALMQELPPGAMAAIGASESEITPLLPAYPGTAIAAVNAPASTVIAGDPAAVTALAAHWQAQGRAITPLNVTRAFHSPHTDPILPQFHATAATLTYRPPVIPVISNLTGQAATSDITTPRYWTAHIRQPVRFADTITTLHHRQVSTYLELGPHPTLAPLIHHNLPHPQPEHIQILTAQRHPHPQPRSWLTTLAHTHTHTTPVNWRPAYPPGTTTTSLPVVN
jgi:acyl transferase domain-containing protein